MTERERYPSEAADRFQVRMTSGLRDRIRIAAEANNRSMNSEIVATLEEKYPEISSEMVQARIQEILEILHNAPPGFVAPGLVAEFQSLVKKFNDLADAEESAQKKLV